MPALGPFPPHTLGEFATEQRCRMLQEQLQEAWQALEHNAEQDAPAPAEDTAISVCLPVSSAEIVACRTPARRASSC